ncbi:class I SAM-dependent methyltransferase [Longimicrobium sp.]|uniref:class I SAM-dependent methyltransferase n=1 Tax=Longimicrobium sp. TaxID=2029185 RepID=UPI002E35502A|nr:class I SAM-dependent methyltransferase [Longimicrobium sp.]HEX6039213.1 class I SAM-dependent methyltransferase [Longimicrobium sp.]
MTQYDTIALEYQRISATVPLRAAEWYSLHQRLGDLEGCSVLDLACGDGMGTRLFKQWGADRVVGVDISSQMIALAQQREDAEPLGIEYRVADAATLGGIGTFDRVAAAYLLHYAESREQLLRMARTVYDNLQPGQTFVASIANPLQPPRPVVDHRKYGWSYRLLDETLREGANLRGTLYLGATVVEFDFFWWSWDTYEEAFRAAGFSECRIEPFLVPPDPDGKRGSGFWDEYLAAPSAMHVICRK